MALSKFMGYAEVLSNINACREFFSWTTSGVIKAIQYHRQNTPQFPADEASTTAQHQIKDEIEQLMDGLWKLKTTMPKMLDLIDSVEWQSHKKHAADLLPDIKDAVYDAEDLLNDFDYYALKLKTESSKTSVHDNLVDTFLEFFNSFRSDGYIRKVNRIQAKLDHIHRQSMDMHLDQAPQKFDKSVRPETCAFIDEPKIFGREEELNQLVSTLIVPARKRGRDDSKSTTVKLHVLPIVGIGGVGKTTIAQQICNDANVRRHFGENIIWTCVSDYFDIKRLTKEILTHFLREGTSSDSLDILLKKLDFVIKSKRFLVVLDDMWDDILKQDGAGWRKLFKRLENGAEGSRVLVTTRSSEVANLVCTVNHYELNGLQGGVFWEFFKLCAFGSTRSCTNRESLECIGKKILPKLKGSPLAAKTIGRLLRMDLNTAHWENIAKSELWQLEQTETDILPALRLSYMYLPQKLKRCFSICAMYPKDHIFEKGFLADVWIAQGYVVGPQEASLCFDALANRSFFQKASPQDQNKYVIHDLMHDTAQLVSKDECFIIKDVSDLDKIPSNVRHLSIFPNKHVDLFPQKNKHVDCSQLMRMCNTKKLRSFVCQGLYDIPEGLGNSNHLRYLGLRKAICELTFPSLFCHLHHLKIIDCCDCVIKRFPPGFSDAISLQKIKSRNFTYDRYQSDKLLLEWSGGGNTSEEAELMFNQMEALPHWNLQHLHVRCYKGESFPSWLRPHLMPRLRTLEFYCCDKIKRIPFFDSTAGARSGSDNNNSIEELVIRKSDQINWQGSVELPTSLRKLILSNSGYSVDQLVSSFHDLTSLTDLQIDDCESLTTIPLHVWSSNLPSMEKLHISFCPRLTSIGVSGENSSSNGFRGFSSLSKIHIRSCDTLLSLEEFLIPDYLPVVKTIFVESCEELTSLSVDRLGGLQELSILDCPKLNPRMVMTFPSTLKELVLLTCGRIESIGISNSQVGSSSALEKLTILSCPVLRSIGGATAVTKIKKVEINYCPELKEIQQPLSMSKVQSDLITDTIITVGRGNWVFHEVLLEGRLIADASGISMCHSLATAWRRCGVAVLMLGGGVVG